MSNLHARLALSSVLSVAAACVNAEQFLCVGEQTTGFNYVGAAQEWRSTKFQATEKYIIKPNAKPYPEAKFIVERFGEPGGYFGACKTGVNEYGYLFCDLIGGELKFNLKNGRYIRTFIGGYISVGQNGNRDADVDTPLITIGKCSAF